MKPGVYCTATMNFSHIAILTVVTVVLLDEVSTEAVVSIRSVPHDDRIKLTPFLASPLSTSPSINTIEKAIQVPEGTFSCSVSDVLADTCQYRFDSACDAGSFCASNSDCYDCDPCGILHGTSCSSCTSDPACSFCEGKYIDTGENFGICSTIAFSQALPNLCWSISGNTGTFDGTTNAFGSATCTDVPVDDNITDTTCNVLNDACPYALDLICDTEGSSPVCDSGTDCFDCDPCQAIVTDAINDFITDSNEVCELCAAAGCSYCTFPLLDGSLIGVCSSPSIALTLPDICTLSGGTSYTNICNGPGPTSAPSQKNTNVTLATCDYANDSCPYTKDKICDAIGGSSTDVNGYCPVNSDCFDCDPCQTLRYDGCDACVAAGCYWCGSDALCLSASPPTIANPITTQLQLTCTNPDDFVQTCPAPDSTKVYSDPLYDAQNWVYEQIGVVDVWKSGITGAGVGIRINDDGVDHTHIEFSSKFNIQSSCSQYTPVILDDNHNHGTTCASIAGGSGNNGACSVGIAPNAAISACRVIKTEFDDILASEFDDSSYFYANMDNMDISSNSYTIPTCNLDKSSLSVEGNNNRQLQQCPFISTETTSPCIAQDCDWSNTVPTVECEVVISIHCVLNFESDVQACTNFLDLFVDCEFNALTMEQQSALNRGVTEGRNGKGIVYIFAGGNDFSSGADVNFAGYQSSRFAITVGAADKNGTRSSYSNGGAALFISAPGGDLDYYTNNVVAFAGGGCTDGGAGTSFAAPVVAGVVALMLEANTELSWRDVQGILASTSTQIQPSDTSWTTNSAGLRHSNIYGFGLVNASAAVDKSKSWSLLTTEIEIITDSEQMNVAIPEYPNEAATSTITVNGTETFKVESVIVYLDLLHSSRGDLKIALTSPSGTTSILSPGQRPENSQNIERWRLMTVRNRDEPVKGDWTISIVDQRLGDLSTCIDTLGWSINITEDLETLEIGCDEFSTLGVCVNKTVGPRFSTFFPSAKGLSDPAFAGTDGLTPDIACCECGGGLPVSNLIDTLHSWRLAIYGSDPQLAALTGGTNGENVRATSGVGGTQHLFHWVGMIPFTSTIGLIVYYIVLGAVN